MRILVVDDHAATRRLLERNLEAASHGVRLAESCAQAASAVAVGAFDVIVLDVMLPDGSGIELCSKLRAAKVTTPILLLTARGEVRDRVRGLESGADDRLSELVEILLWFARAQMPLDDAGMDIVNLADVVRSQVADRARVEPSFVARCDLPDEALVRGDERLLCRVAANLIDNAVKHGEGGAVELRAGRDAGLVQLSVTNRGQLGGDLVERVFEPFFRGPRASGLPGFGLGLPFARAVARAHGGDVVLGEGRGDETVLVLRLPMVAWSDPSAAS